MAGLHIPESHEFIRGSMSIQKKILIFIASQNVPRKNSIMLVGFDEISVLQASAFRYGDNETYGLKLLFGKCT